MPRGSSPKRGRQHGHIKSGARERRDFAASVDAAARARRTAARRRTRGGETRTVGPGSKRGFRSLGHDDRIFDGGSAGPGFRRSRSSRRLRGLGENRRRLRGRTGLNDIRGRSSADEAQSERAFSPAAG